MSSLLDVVFVVAGIGISIVAYTLLRIQFNRWQDWVGVLLLGTGLGLINAGFGW